LYTNKKNKLQQKKKEKGTRKKKEQEKANSNKIKQKIKGTQHTQTKKNTLSYVFNPTKQIKTHNKKCKNHNNKKKFPKLFYQKYQKCIFSSFWFIILFNS